MLQRFLFPVFFALTALPVLCRPAVCQTVQLADGRVLLATVEDAGADGLRVHRLDNGGYLDLRWDHLSTASANAWKRKFDLLGDSQDELLERGDEVVFMLNGARTTVLGRIVSRTPEAILVQTKAQQVKVPRGDLLTVRPVDVPVSQLFTKDEFYARHMAELAPGESADRWLLLADDLIKVRDYEHANECLNKAKELGNSRDPQRIETQLQRLTRYKEAEKELGLLDEIKACRMRGRLLDFEKGNKLIAQFEKDYPASKLATEFKAEKGNFEKSRQRYLTSQVAEKWRHDIQSLAEKKVTEGLKLDQIKDYAENKMTEEIINKVAADLNLQPAEVQTLWANRVNTPVGKRPEHFDYGIGSWVLGKEAILKDTDRGDAMAKQQPAATPDSGANAQAERFAKLMKEAMNRARQQQQQQNGEQKEMTPDDWWNQAARAEQVRWLRAYYAEFGGQLKLTYASVAPCISCYGQGTTAAVGADGKLVKTKCMLCQGMKWLRSFNAY